MGGGARRASAGVSETVTRVEPPVTHAAAAAATASRRRQPPPPRRAHLLLRGALRLHVALVLRLEDAQLVALEHLVGLLDAVHALGRLGLDHLEVELIRVAVLRLLAQLRELLLLVVEVARALHVVLLLLEQPVLGARRGLRALVVLAPAHGVLERRGRHSSALRRSRGLRARAAGSGVPVCGHRASRWFRVNEECAVPHTS